MSKKFNIAILFAYNGSEFDGLERIKGKSGGESQANAVEEFLFKAFPLETVSVTHISRASLTQRGEHASKQVISLQLVAEEIPTVEQLNAKLPETIRIFKVEEVSSSFSARRTCQARTIEFLIPTYSFAPPPKATLYCNPEVLCQEHTIPEGVLFETIKRKRTSMDRRNTFMRHANSDEYYLSTPPISPPGTPTKGALKPRNTIEKDFFMNAKTGTGSERLKVSLSTTLTRRKNTNALSKEEPLSSTLRRSLSQNRRSLKDVLTQDILEREETEDFSFEPLNIPVPGDDEKASMKAYRMSKNQYATVVSTLALFNVQDDSRCFVHIFDIGASALEIVGDMEWIRVKVQANAFARDQVRRMMAMLVLVIRTNTPRSVLGNSFGFSKIDIPEAPVGFQILDEPHYNNYNVDAVQNGKTTIRFGDVEGPMEFRRGLHRAVVDKEASEMAFGEWLREIDNFSFMYTHFLNVRGVITKPRNFPVFQEEETCDGQVLAPAVY